MNRCIVFNISANFMTLKYMDQWLYSRQNGNLLLLQALLGLSDTGSQLPWENVSVLSKKNRQKLTAYLLISTDHLFSIKKKCKSSRQLMAILSTFLAMKHMTQESHQSKPEIKPSRGKKKKQKLIKRGCTSTKEEDKNYCRKSCQS